MNPSISKRRIRAYYSMSPANFNLFNEVFMSFASLRRIMPQFIAMSFLASFAATSQAAPGNSEKITMHSEVVETPTDVFSYIDRVNVYPETTPFNGSSENVEIDAIINLAQKAWEIVKANAPVAQIKFNFANALPKGVKNSSSLTGFSDVQSKSVRIWGTNMWGATVYDLTLTAVHQFGGQYEGKGHYLETVSVIPSNISVLWGYTVNYSVEQVATTNGGTAEDPIAKMALHAKFKVETVIQKDETNTIFQFRGDSPKVTTSGI